jgi:hypothetical protein
LELSEDQKELMLEPALAALRSQHSLHFEKRWQGHLSMEKQEARQQ